MAFHNVYQADVKADLYGLSIADGQVVILFGDTTRGDINPYVYMWDGSSSASDNFPLIVNPTGHMGNGRYVKIDPDQVKSNWSEAVSSALAFIQNKPTLATVATSGAYADLSGKPTLATVATSGSYSDLSNTPTALVPTGALFMWGTGSAPTGYLLCNGALVSRTTYATLFGVIAATFGAGDGSTTFSLPDMRQRFPMGVAASGTGNILGATGGLIDHTHTIAHTHQVDPPNTTTGAPSATVQATILAGGAASTTHTHDVNIPAFTSGAESAANSGSANPPFIAINFIIKT